MKKFNLIALMAIFVIMSLTLFGCGSQSQPESGATNAGGPQKVVVAVINDYPPMEFKQAGKLVGFDIDLVEAIAKQQNLQIEWKEMKFDGIIPALQAKQVDAAVSAITIRPDRQEVVDFTDPYMTSGLSLIVNKNGSVKKLEDLKGKTIVAKQGTTGLEKAKELAEKYGAKVKILQDDTALYLDVETGNSDATINDFSSAAYKVKVDGDKSKLTILGDKLTGEDYGIAIVKGNKDLLDKFNNGIKALKDNGEYDNIMNKYFATN